VILFEGISTVNLDAKGRMAMPTRYRGDIDSYCQGQMVLTVHQDGCLLLYAAPDWPEIRDKLIRLSNQLKRSRRLQRMVLGHATAVEMDGHGRILVPPTLREFAKLEKRLVLAGVGNKFEIWNEAVWNRGCEEWLATPDDDSGLPEELENLTL